MNLTVRSTVESQGAVQYSTVQYFQHWTEDLDLPKQRVLQYCLFTVQYDHRDIMYSAFLDQALYSTLQYVYSTVLYLTGLLILSGNVLRLLQC